jgi:amidase
LLLPGIHAAGEGERGVATCPFDFYRTWVNAPEEARAISEAITRDTIGVAGCPVAGVPAPPPAKEAP